MHRPNKRARYLDQQTSSRPRPAASGSSNASDVVAKAKYNLGQLFDSYRGKPCFTKIIQHHFERSHSRRTDAKDAQGEIGIEGTLKYMQDLNVDMDSAQSVIPLEITQSPSMGVITKQAFIDGWMKAMYAMPSLQNYANANIKQRWRKADAGHHRQASRVRQNPNL